MAPRRRTITSNVGVSTRESHDARPFYDRFPPPAVSTDDSVAAPAPVAEPFVHGDARHMDAVAVGSVALVVTSPPYFAGKLAFCRRIIQLLDLFDSQVWLLMLWRTNGLYALRRVALDESLAFSPCKYRFQRCPVMLRSLCAQLALFE